MTPGFLEDRSLRLLLFGGKGGAGKTTCAAAAALWLARRNPERRYLVVSTDPAHSLRDSLGDVRLPQNLAAEELDAGAALEEFRRAYASRLEEIAARGTFLSDDQIRRVLDLSLPGLDELMAFLKIAERVAAREWDCVLVDTAPTGHTVRLLEIPHLMELWLAALEALLAKHRYLRQVFTGSSAPDRLDDALRELSERVEGGRALLRGAAVCRFVPVMLAERLSVRETEALLAALERLRIGVQEVVVNRLYGETSCLWCAAVGRAQRNELDGLASGRWTRYRLWGVPAYPGEVRGGALETFWDETRTLGAAAAHSAGPKAVSWRVKGMLAPLPEAVRLLLVGGKGGVGKTTIACAVALAAAREQPERRILLFSADPAHSLGDCLGREIGPRPVNVRDRLDAVEIDAASELSTLKRQYGAGLERFFSTLSQNFDPVFDRDAMERLLDLAPPGLDEIMALCRMTQWLAARRYETVIVDSAATGHMLRLLELPALAQDWLRVLFGILLDYEQLFRAPEFAAQLVEFSRQLKRLRTLLADARQAQVYAVTIPTVMALEEASDLLAACDRLGIHVAALLVNLVTGPGDCLRCKALRRQEAAVLARLRRLSHGRSLVVIERTGEPLGVELEVPGLFAAQGSRMWATN